jgi:hypothetical protein
MHTVQNYIYAQQQMHFSDMDYYEAAGIPRLQVEEICDFFPDLTRTDEAHPMLGYYGC